MQNYNSVPKGWVGGLTKFLKSRNGVEFGVEVEACHY